MDMNITEKNSLAMLNGSSTELWIDDFTMTMQITNLIPGILGLTNKI